MRSSIKSTLSSIFSSLIFFGIIYVGFFTNIPEKTSTVYKVIKEERSNDFEVFDSNFKVNKLAINMGTYYYDYLTDGQKIIYASIANAVKNYQNEFVIRDYEAPTKDEFASEVKEAIGAFMNDHPEAFYLKANYSSYVVEGLTQNYGYVRLNYTDEDLAIIEEKIDKMDKKITEYTQDLDGKTEFEKELIIHDRFSYDVVYSDLDEFPRQYHTAEGPMLNGVGVCDGFTKSLQLIFDRVGIDSIIVLGKLNEPHAWNLVKIEDEWYHVDLTSSHSIFGDTGKINHAYFNMDDERLKKFGTMDEEEIIPRATSIKYWYFNVKDLVITEEQDLYTRLENVVEVCKNENAVEFYLEGNVPDKISNVLISLKTIDSSLITGTKLYYYNIQNAIIIPKN